jgi:hypothetical protein
MRVPRRSKKARSLAEIAMHECSCCAVALDADVALAGALVVLAHAYRDALLWTEGKPGDPDAGQ